MNRKTVKILYPSSQSINENEFIIVINMWQHFIFQNVKSLCISIAKNGMNSPPFPNLCPFQYVLALIPIKRWSLILYPLNLNLPCDILLAIANRIYWKLHCVGSKPRLYETFHTCIVSWTPASTMRTTPAGG